MLKEENIYKAPASDSEYQPQRAVKWSGQKLFCITCIPSLLLLASYLFVILVSQAGGVFILFSPVVAAISCSIWTGCHFVKVSGGNWLDSIGYSVMWAVIHTFTIMLSFFLVLILLSVISLFAGYS